MRITYTSPVQLHLLPETPEDQLFLRTYMKGWKTHGVSAFVDTTKRSYSLTGDERLFTEGTEELTRVRLARNLYPQGG